MKKVQYAYEIPHNCVEARLELDGTYTVYEKGDDIPIIIMEADKPRKIISLKDFISLFSDAELKALYNSKSEDIQIWFIKIQASSEIDLEEQWVKDGLLLIGKTI